MKKSNLHILFILLTLIGFSLQAQNDSLKLFSLQEFLELVKNHHPIARQAALQVEKGNASVLNAQGGFDPKIYYDINEKQYKSKLYQSLMNGGLTIPTWVGLDVKAAFEQNDGVFLNPEHNIPTGGLWYAGVSLPVGQGLFIDERRATLKQAKLFKSLTQAEQRLMMNELLYEAGNKYWEWFLRYNYKRVYESVLVVSQQRFDALKQNAFLGDRPFIDTVEAGIQLQLIKLGLSQAELDFKNSSLMLSTFLWLNDYVPLELSNNAIPMNYESIIEQKLFQTSIPLFSDSAVKTHPTLLMYDFKLKQLEVEKAWKKEKLKPVLNINYNAITSTTGNDAINSFTTNNYKWGLDFSIPLFLRKERGDLQLTRLKQQEVQLDVTNKNLEITNKIKFHINEFTALKSQINLFSNTVRDYETLLNAEKNMFEIGESSLFIINSRESNLINARLKLAELVMKNQKSLLSIAYAQGNLAK